MEYAGSGPNGHVPKVVSSSSHLMDQFLASDGSVEFADALAMVKDEASSPYAPHGVDSDEYRRAIGIEDW